MNWRREVGIEPDPGTRRPAGGFAARGEHQLRSLHRMHLRRRFIFSFYYFNKRILSKDGRK